MEKTDSLAEGYITQAFGGLGKALVFDVQEPIAISLEEEQAVPGPVEIALLSQFFMLLFIINDLKIIRQVSKQSWKLSEGS